MKEALLILFGFLLGFIPPWFTRRRRIKTHLCAMRAEIDQCKEKSETLIKDQVMSPLYRFPLIAYKVSFPVLLADGAINENEVLHIGRFFSLVEEMNRGLDYAAEMKKLGDEQQLQQEFNRNCLKAKALIEPSKGLESLYDKVKCIIDSKVSLKWWQYSNNI